MSEQNTPIRPLCLELEEAKAEIFAVINMTAKKHNIPFFLLEYIMQEATRQVVDLAKAERKQANENYTQQLAQYNKRGERDEQ